MHPLKYPFLAPDRQARSSLRLETDGRPHLAFGAVSFLSPSTAQSQGGFLWNQVPHPVKTNLTPTPCPRSQKPAPRTSYAWWVPREHLLQGCLTGRSSDSGSSLSSERTRSGPEVALQVSTDTSENTYSRPAGPRALPVFHVDFSEATLGCRVGSEPHPSKTASRRIF